MFGGKQHNIIKQLSKVNLKTIYTTLITFHHYPLSCFWCGLYNNHEPILVSQGMQSSVVVTLFGQGMLSQFSSCH